MKEKPTVDSPFVGTFPPDPIPKKTKDVSVHSLIHSSNSSKLYLRIPGIFCSYYVNFTLKKQGATRHILNS